MHAEGLCCRARCQRQAQHLLFRDEQESSEKGTLGNTSAPPLGLIAPLLGEAGFSTRTHEAVAVPIDLRQQSYSERVVGPGLKHAYPSYAEATRREVVMQTMLPGMVLFVGVATGIIVLCTI